MLEGILQDVRYALRWLARSPGFAAVAVLSLGIGIGFNAAIFSVLDALLLRPLPVREPARLADIFTSGSDGDTYSSSSLPDVLDYRAQTSAFADVAAYTPMFAAVTRAERSRLVLGEIVTGNYFTMLGVNARVGRTLVPDDDGPTAPRAVVISHPYWQRELGADPAAIGGTIRIRGEQFTIVGVLDESFTGMVPMLAPEIWITTRHVDDVEPFGLNDTVPSPTGTSRLDRRGQRWLFAKARLKPGASIEQARANIDVVTARLRSEYPQTNKDRRASLKPSSETRVHPQADGILKWVVSGTMAAVGLVLIIACANVAGMLLARASARQREIAIRLAVGASRRRLMQQLLTEGLVLGLLGAAVGTWLAMWLTRLLTTIDLPIPIALSLDLRLDRRVLGFMLIVASVTGILAGMAPALRATRSNIVGDLKSATSERRAGRRWTGRDGLVIVQMAVTVVLLVIAGLLVRSLQAAARADVGFAADGLAIVSADTEMLRYSPERSKQYWDEVQRRIQSLPGVQHVALASRLPFSINFNRTNIAVPGRQKSPDEMGPSINSGQVSADYFATIGIDLLRGRTFTDADTPERPAVALVSETMARTYWPGQDAIGQTVYERTLNSGRSFQIVGVVADHKLQSVSDPPLAVIYFAKSQRPTGFNVVVARTTGNDVALVNEIRRVMVGAEPNLLIMESQTMRAQMQALLFPVRVAAALVAVFSVLAMLLAAVGLYGIVAFTVAERTREIGIRMAIGARPREVLAVVMRQGVMLAAIGLTIGFALGALATRVVANALYGIGAADPIAWGVAATALVGLTLAAHAVPAYRAMHLDPVRCLRTE